MKCKSNGAVLDFLHVSTQYHAKGSIARVIKSIKYSSYSRIIYLLPGFLFTTPQFIEDNTILCPVPLHRSRKRTRGFNQAYLIAYRLQQCTSIPIIECLSRQRKTSPQASLSKLDREQNLSGAFSYRKVHASTIILVDDVATTLSTLEECARTIKNKSPISVGAFVLARGQYNL